MPLSKESLKVLESVKKSGKPCRFVLVKKAGDVAAIAAYRKGSEQTHTANAKDEAGGGGDAFTGVIDGQGVNLRFTLLSSQFPSAPVKDSKLKEFLKGCDKAFKDNKASFDVVDKLPDVSEDDDQPPQGQKQPQTGNQQPGNQPQRADQQVGKYLTADEWKQIITAIHTSADLVVKTELFVRAQNECNAETDRARQEAQTNPQSPATQALVTLTKVADKLKTLNPAKTMPQAPLNPTLQALQNVRADQQAVRNELQLGKGKITEKREMLNPEKIAGLLQECETDANSDFGQIVSLLDLKLTKPPKKKGGQPEHLTAIDGNLVDKTMSNLIQAKQKAAAYIKEHKDPIVGSLPTRVKKRRQHCEQIIKDVDAYIVFIGDKNGAALDLCKKYGDKAKAGGYVPPAVGVELNNLLNEALLTDETKFEIRKTIDLLSAETQKLGFDLLAKTPNMPAKEKLEIMEAYGCGSKPSGGTSDVKLLKGSPNGGIEYALKSAAQESEQALDQLGLPNGACAIREDVSSAIFEKFKEITHIDLGFPKSEVQKVNGQTYAVIEGIKGKMADREGLAEIQRDIDAAKKLKEKLEKRQRPPEEIQEADAMINKLTNKLQSAKQDMEAIPDTITSESMGKVLMSSIMACQWDCKWGNLIVENGNARPIDAGAALPTKKSLDGFLQTDHKKVFGVPALEQLVLYPQGHSKALQDLPIANQPVDYAMVAEMLNLDADAMVQAAKQRRDKVMQDNPELGGGTALLEDSAFEAMRESINGAKQILQSKPDITLKEFVQGWTKWFENWAPGFYQRNFE